MERLSLPYLRSIAFDSDLQDEIEAAKEKYERLLRENQSRLCDKLCVDSQVLNRMCAVVKEEQNWTVVRSDLEVVAKASAGSKSDNFTRKLSSKLQSLRRNIGRYEPTMNKWMSLLPTESMYCSLLCGAFKIGLTVSGLPYPTVMG